MDRDDYPSVDVQANPEQHRDQVVTCLTDHLDAGHVDSVTSFGRDPRSILAVCDRCQRKWWFEEIEEDLIPGTDEHAERWGEA